MGSTPAVLVLDDGELDDIQQMLQEMAIPFARIRGGAIVQGTPPPRDLLVATPRRIGAVKEAVGDAIDPPIRVMVVNEDSNALRSQLRRSGFDYLVRRPVHAEALRLMLLHCAYKGEERRNEPRVAVGFEVSFRAGLVTRRATLVDLSSRGCRLLSRHRVERGKRIKVWIPDAIGAGEPLVAVGRIVHVERAESVAQESVRLGVAFEPLDADTRRALALVIEDYAHGPATLRGKAPEQGPQTEPTPPAAEPPAKPGVPQVVRPVGGTPNRRRRARAAYSQTVPAFGDRALRVLVGRDLSMGGMRIQPQDEVEVGDRLHLAIYGEPGSEPLLVWGEVGRNAARRAHDPLRPARRFGAAAPRAPRREPARRGIAARQRGRGDGNGAQRDHRLSEPWHLGLHSSSLGPLRHEGAPWPAARASRSASAISTGCAGAAGPIAASRPRASRSRPLETGKARNRFRPRASLGRGYLAVCSGCGPNPEPGVTRSSLFFEPGDGFLGRRRHEALGALGIAAPPLTKHALEHRGRHLGRRAPEERPLDHHRGDRHPRRVGRRHPDEPLVAAVGVLARETARLARNAHAAEQRLAVALAEGAARGAERVVSTSISRSSAASARDSTSRGAACSGSASSGPFASQTRSIQCGATSSPCASEAASWAACNGVMRQPASPQPRLPTS